MYMIYAKIILFNISIFYTLNIFIYRKNYTFLKYNEILLYIALYNNIDNIILFKKIKIKYLITILIYPLNKYKQ